MKLDDRVTEHFTWREVVFSEMAVRRGIDNTPPEDLMPNIYRQASFMEQLRFVLGGRPIFISSWYRCLELNKAIGGSTTSVHMLGLACDFLCPAMGSPLQVAEYLAQSTELDFDQIIHEYGRWVHVGLNMGNRKQLLTAYRQEGRVVFVPGLVEVPQ